MRGPARVADAISSFQRLLANRFFQIAQLAFGAPDVEPTLAMIADNSDSR